MRGHYNTDKARTDSYNTNQGRRHYYITEDQIRGHFVVAVEMAQHVPIETVEQKSEDCIKNVFPASVEYFPLQQACQHTNFLVDIYA